jgi:hypothetical protein
VIEFDEGTGRKANDSKIGVAGATSRGLVAGIISRTEPGDHQCN